MRPEEAQRARAEAVTLEERAEQADEIGLPLAAENYRRFARERRAAARALETRPS